MMRVIIVGMGIQGRKRKKFLGKEFKYSVDKYKTADFHSIYEVPLKKYDAVLVCVPDNEKFNIINYCIKNKKHVLVEKPLLIKNTKKLKNLINLSKKNKTVLYTAYNHRFEPNIVKMKKIIQSRKLGTIYKCRMFYGNGTAILVKKNKWRDKDLGVLSDIGSHLLDTCLFWFGKKINSIKLVEINKFENKAPDYAVVSLNYKKIKIQLEMTLCMWRNSFYCDLIGSKGSAHLNSLCKWSKSFFSHRLRRFPSGRPVERVSFFKKGDPTWGKEYIFFKNLIYKKNKTNYQNNLIINNCFLKLRKVIS